MPESPLRAGRRRGRAREALPELVGLTTATDPRVRWHAARSIGLIGEDAIAEIPALLKLLQDADPVVATQAAAAIGHIREDDNRADLPQGLLAELVEIPGSPASFKLVLLPSLLPSSVTGGVSIAVTFQHCANSTTTFNTSRVFTFRFANSAPRSPADSNFTSMSV